MSGGMPVASRSRKRRERMVAILGVLSARNAVDVDELAHELGISPATARRDLAQLEAQHLLVRTHGGAMSVKALAELPVELRDTRSQEAKRAIAREAARQVPANCRAVALSGGTTTAAVVDELAARRDLTILTNSLTIAVKASEYPQLKMMVTGGVLRPQSFELVGGLAESTFRSVNIPIAIVGADGVTAAAGLTTHDDTEAKTNHAMLARATRTIAVADGSKIGRVAFATLASIGEVDTLITDAGADATELDRLRAGGLDVVLA